MTLHLEIHSKQPSGHGTGAILGLILVALLVVLLGLAWTRRKQMKSLLKDRDRYETIVKYMTQQSQQVLVDPPKEEDMDGSN